MRVELLAVVHSHRPRRECEADGGAGQIEDGGERGGASAMEADAYAARIRGL